MRVPVHAFIPLPFTLNTVSNERPDLGVLTFACCEEPRTIGRHGDIQTPCLAHPWGPFTKLQQTPPCLQVPHLGCLVATAGAQKGTIARQYCRGDVILVGTLGSPRAANIGIGKHA